MSSSLVLDLGIAVILLFFLVRGMQVGFVRALCSLLALFVAFFGALFLSRMLTPPATQLLAPHVLPAIIQRLEDSPTPPPETAITSADALSLLQNIGLPESWNDMLAKQSAADSDATSGSSPAQLLASYLLRIILSAALFILCFFLILLLWRLLSNSLDLVARLPVLNFCNHILGGVLGLLKALLALFLLRWLLIDLLGLISPALLEQTHAARLLGELLPYLREQRFFPF